MCYNYCNHKYVSVFLPGREFSQNCDRTKHLTKHRTIIDPGRACNVLVGKKICECERLLDSLKVGAGACSNNGLAKAMPIAVVQQTLSQSEDDTGKTRAK